MRWTSVVCSSSETGNLWLRLRSCYRLDKTAWYRTDDKTK